VRWYTIIRKGRKKKTEILEVIICRRGTKIKGHSLKGGGGGDRTTPLHYILAGERTRWVPEISR